MISMITCRSDLYQRLWEEYFPLDSEKKHESFFYRYLKRKKDDQATRIAASADSLAEYCERKKRDKYILLRSTYLAYKNGIITATEYIQRFAELAGAKGRKKYDPFTPDMIEQAEQAFENEFIVGCISDFFYNMGFRLRSPKSEANEIGYTKLSERYLKEKDGYIDDLDLWASYYIFSLKDEAQPPSFVSELTEEYIGKCRHLFSVLNREDYDNAFVPLYFDHGSGAGVIIAGNSILPEEKQSNSSCRICIAYFSMAGSEINEYGELDITMMTELYDDVDQAFERFRKGIAAQEYCENYSDQNDEIPDGIDNVFRSYFLEKAIREPSYNTIIQEYNRKEKISFQKSMEEKEKRNERLRQNY